MRRQWLNSIITLLCLVSCSSVFGQELHDYRYYKLFEEPSAAEQPLIETDSLPALAVRSGFDSRLFDYNFGFVRHARRGAFYHEHKTSLNGIRISGLYTSDGYRLQLETNTDAGIALGRHTMGGTTAIADYTIAYPARQRTNIGFSVSSRNLPGTISTTTAQHIGKDWSIVADVAARAGKDMHIDGVFTDEARFNIVATGRIDSLHHISFALLASPSRRGVRSSSIKQAFSLTGNPLYNPAWGYSNEVARSSRIRRDLTPILITSYDGCLSKKTSFTASFGATIGYRSISMLDWFDAPTPAPDNYRYMPDYYTDADIADAVANVWRENDSRYTQVNFDELYARNQLNGKESLYAIADQMERTTTLQLHAVARTQIDIRNSLTYGIDGTIDRSRYFKQMRDLLGGEYVTDIDHYLIDDDSYRNSLQNNLYEPNRKIGVGDRYGYDYALTSNTLSLFAIYRHNTERLLFDAGAQVGYASVTRRGYYCKELFADTSFGRSRRLKFSPFALRAAMQYTLSESHTINAAISIENSPAATDDYFLQAEYNNRTIDSPTAAQQYAAEFGYTFSHNRLQLRLTAFTRLSQNEAQTMRLYDDVSGEYSDIVTSHIGRLAIGIEAETKWRFMEHWTLSGAIAAGRYTYAGNPLVSVYRDTDNHLLADRNMSYTGGCYIGNAPQLMATLRLEYYNRGWRVALDGAYAGMRYVTPSFLRRTERVFRQASSPEMHDRFINQERLPDAFTVDASLSKSIYLQRYDRRIYSTVAAPRFIDRHPHSYITIFFAVRNLTGNRNTIYSGYESSRLHKQYLADGYSFRPQANRYLYAYPRTYYLSVRFTF